MSLLLEETVSTPDTEGSLTLWEGRDTAVGSRAFRMEEERAVSQRWKAECRCRSEDGGKE